MKYLIAVDLEGVHGTAGAPFHGEMPHRSLPRDSSYYTQAVELATKEVNVAVKALFDSGAKEVCVWDNHGGGGNLDFSKIDARARNLIPDRAQLRMEFLRDEHFDGVVFIGYHSKAGSINGVMSHTYNGWEIQYIKLDGKQLGEFDFDARIAGEFGVPAIFAASDDIAVKQFSECNPLTETVVTKYGKGRHEAEFREEETVLDEIYVGVKRSVSSGAKPVKFRFPCVLEIRYTRLEIAAYHLETLSEKVSGLGYGEDGNVLKATLQNIDDLRLFL